MAKVIVTATVTAQDFPFGTAQGQWRIDIGPATETLVDTPSAEFNDVAPGSYVATVQALDSGGAAIGPAATAPFTFDAQVPVSLQVAGVVSVSVNQ